MAAKLKTSTTSTHKRRKAPTVARTQTPARRAFDRERVSAAIAALRDEGAKSFTDPDAASTAECVGSALAWSTHFYAQPELVARLAFECFEEMNARRTCAILDRLYNLFPAQWETLADFRAHAQQTGNPQDADALAWGETDPAARFAHNGFYILAEKENGARRMWEYVATGFTLDAHADALPPAPETRGARAQWTPPRVYKDPQGIPYRVAIYGRDADAATLRTVCELRDPTPRDVANFEQIAHAPRVIDAARDALAELYALRDRDYFRAHPTDTGALSITLIELETALRDYDAGAGIVESEGKA